jgi:exo-beta-1,3-glucanase (GH17 family)
MKFLPFVAALAVAQPLHQHNQHKRDVITVLVTEVVTAVSGQTTTSQALVTPAATVLTNMLSGSSFDTVYVSTAPTFGSSQSKSASSVQWSASTTLSQTTVSTASSTRSSATSTSTSTSSAQGKGITYSPYTNSGTCKAASDISSDIAKLSSFDLIRLYDTDCDCVSAVLNAKTSTQKLFLGIYYLSKIESSVSIISDAVKGNWNDIYTVSVGNELVNSGGATTDQIKSAVDTARSLLNTAGYTGPVVSVDTLVAVQNNPVLCDYSDYVAVNSHPFWDGSVLPENSGTWLKQQIANIKQVCGGSKDVLITETGWPTQGSNYGSAVPSKENQALALESISSTVADQVLLFTTYNDLWKDAGSYGVEQYWGIFD